MKGNIMKGKEIKGFEGYYVTEEGQVWSYKKSKDGKLLKPQTATQSRKYKQVRLFSKQKESGQLNYIHRLVYETWVGEIPDEMTIDHIDGNQSNNHYTNLQLLTRNDNTRKSVLGNKRTDMWRNRDEVIEKYKELKSQTKLAKYYNCSLTHIWRVIHGKVKRVKNGKVYYEDISEHENY